ncbi:MAG: PAS domain S-box protein, partial [Candidatus Marinimicrobia bacterium]|nr:PAS domain S-box protein [Candidatus Neomarinimicrobiota bacterium]
MQKKTKTAFTDPQSAREHLHRLENRYNAFLNSSEDGIWCFESAIPIPINLPATDIIRSIFENGILVECNQAYAQMHSYSKPEDIIGAPLLKFVRQNDPQLITIFKNFIQSRYRLTNVEFHRHRENESEKIFIISLFGVIENDCLIQAWGVQRDITAQTRTQEKIKRSELRYRNIFDYAFDAIFIETFDGSIQAVNKRASEMLGYTRDEFLKMNIRQLIPESYHDKLTDLNLRIKNDGIAIVRSKNHHKNGQMIDVEICAKLLSEDEQDFVQVFVRDISQQVRFREQIQSLSAQIEQFSQISADIITITDQSELFRRISDAIAEISDFSRVLFYTFKDTPPFRDILGHVGISGENLKRIQRAEAPREKFLDLFEKGIRLGNQSCYIPHAMKHLVNQHTVDYGKKDYSRKNGWHREDNLLVAMKNKSGDIIGMISLDDSKSGLKPSNETVKPIELFANHISQIIKLKQLEEEQREIEERFQQSEKLRALGEMAGGVAHDFNNVLSAILGRAQLLKRDITDPEIIHGLEIIEKAAIDGADTIRRIQEFTRLRTDKKFAGISINDTIRDSIKYTRTRWKDDAEERGIKIEIETHFGEEPLVEANSSEMREVFTNLILNAIEAMPESGKIKIETQASADIVQIVLSDTGTGMSPDILKRIFDPFFTTKGVKGTGLGLSVTYGIVHRHNGTIEIDSQLGRGTTVIIRFPRFIEGKSVIPEQVTKDKTQPDVPNAKILIVDDEEYPRELLKDILEMYGHAVFSADSGKSAL